MRQGYFLSPEFHRNIWMRFSLVGATATALFAMLVGSLMGNLWTAGLDLRAQVMFFMFVLLVVIPGNYAAAFSMREEMKDNTWDFLRVSAISPAQLAFGKLFGSTSQAWYWGILVGFLYYNTFWQEASVHVLSYYMVMAALMGHATAYLISMSSVPASSQHMVSRDVGMGTPAFITGCGVSLGIITTFIEAFFYHYGGFKGQERFYTELVWYEHSYEIFSFWAVSMAVGLFWLLLGGYRLVRAELMYRMTPIAWSVFLACLIFWVMGFAFNLKEVPDLKNYLYVNKEYISHYVIALSPYVLAAKWAFFISAALCYFTMLSESSDVRRYSRLVGAIRRRDFRNILGDLPRWVAVLPFVAVSFAAVVYFLRASPPGEEADVSLLYFMTGTLLFIARDGFVLHLLHARLRRRAAIAVLLYFVSVVVALPCLLLSTAHKAETFKRLVAHIVEMCKAAKSVYYLFPEEPAFGLLFPTGTPVFATSILPAVLQAALAGLLFFWFINKRQDNARETAKA